MPSSRAVRTTPVAATTKTRGIAAIVLGGALAATMVVFMARGGFQPVVLVVFAAVLLAGIAFVSAGVALFRNGAMSSVHKGVVIGALVLVAVTVGVLKDRLGLGTP